MAGIPLSSGFSLNAQQSLDTRSTIDTLANRDLIPSIQRYLGMEVYCLADKKKYILKNGITNTDWEEFSSGTGGTSDIDFYEFSIVDDELIFNYSDGDIPIDMYIDPSDSLIVTTTDASWINVASLPLNNIVGIKGDTGETGDPEVYFGETEPIDPKVTVWIREDGTPTDPIPPTGSGVIPLISMTETTAILDPDKMYTWGEVAQLNISLRQPSNITIVSKYMFQFTSGNPPTILAIIPGVLWIGGIPNILQNRVYQAYITNGIGTMLVAELPVVAITAQQWVDDITVGWNLAGSLDSTGSYIYTDVIGTDKEAAVYETMWGNPVTTKAMIDTVKAKGFNAIRIPVTWAHHLNSSFVISSYWMDRVEQVVNYAIANGLKCIINTHHDHSNYNDGKSWLNVNPSTISTVRGNFITVWSQIANRFKNYNTSLLIFEAFNEIMTSDRDWSPPLEEEYNALNILTQTFVDTVRATGGNNLRRILSINTYAAGTTNLDYFHMPNDLEEGYLLAQIHVYENRTNQEIEGVYTKLDTYFGNNNIPVIIGECGTTIATNYDVRLAVAKNQVARASAHGYKCFVWDSLIDYQMLNRTNLTWRFDELADAYVEGVTGEPIVDVYSNVYTYNEITPFTFGGLDEITGLAKTFSWGGIRLTNRLEVTPEYQYIINIKSSDNGYRIDKLFWYDELGNFIAPCTYFDGNKIGNQNEGVVLATVKAPNNARYLNFYVYNPWTSKALSGFTASMTGGALTVTVSETIKEASTTPIFNLSTVSLSNIANWKSGDYDAACTRYRSDSSKVSLTGLLECEPGVEYKIQISNPNVGMIVRQLDNQGTMVYSHNYCSNGMYLPVSDKTKNLMLVLFSLTEEFLNFEDFQNEFNNGLTILVTKEVNPLLNANGNFSMDTLDFANIVNYRTGTYDVATGVYSNLWYNYHRMCLSHLIEVSPTTLYSPTLTTGYAMIAIEMDVNKTFIRSLGTIKNGGVFVTSSTARYLSVSFAFYDTVALKTITSKVFKDFYTTLNSQTFTFDITVSLLKVMTLIRSQGISGYSLTNPGGVLFNVGDNNYVCFNSINVSSFKSKDIYLRCSTGTLFLAQYDANGVCIVNTQSIGNDKTMTLNANAASIRFSDTWMNSSSTVIFAYDADVAITY